PVSTNEPTKLPPNDPVPEIMAAAGVTPGTQFGGYLTTIIRAEEKPQEDLPNYSNTAASAGQQDLDLPAGYDLPPEETPEEIYLKETRRRIAEKRAQQIELAISSKSNINFERETNTSGGAFGAMAHSSNPLSQLAAVEQQLKQTA